VALNVTALFEYRRRSKDWSQQDLAEFFRIEGALVQGGLQIETARGVSDEGEPWFIFCRVDNGEPVAHFALIEGQYVMASLAHPGTARGNNLRSLVQQLISRHSLVQAVPARSNVLIHPSALLIALIGAAFFALADRADAADASANADASKPGPEAKKLTTTAGLLHHNVPAAAPDELSLGNYGREAVLIAVAAALTMVGEPDLAKVFMSQGIADGLSSVATPEVVGHTISSLDTSLESLTVISSHVSDSSAQAFNHPDGAPLDQQPVKPVIVKGAEVTHPSETFGLGGLAPAQLALLPAPKDVPVSLDTAHSLDGGIINMGFASVLRTDVPAAPQANSDSHLSAATILDVKTVLDVLGGVAHVNVAQMNDPLPSAVTNALSQGLIVSESGTIVSFLQNHQQFLAANFVAADTTALREAGNPGLSSIMEQPVNAADSTLTLISNVSGQTASNLSATNVASFLEAFLHHDQGIQVFVTRDSLVLVNSNAISQAGAGAEGITLNFSDGSSLSLVGQPAAIHHIIEIV